MTLLTIATGIGANSAIFSARPLAKKWHLVHWSEPVAQRLPAALAVAFCKKAIEWQGGRVWIESAPVGTKFYFTKTPVDDHTPLSRIPTGPTGEEFRSKLIHRAETPAFPTAGFAPG